MLSPLMPAISSIAPVVDQDEPPRLGVEVRRRARRRADQCQLVGPAHRPVVERSVGGDPTLDRRHQVHGRDLRDARVAGVSVVTRTGIDRRMPVAPAAAVSVAVASTAGAAMLGLLARRGTCRPPALVRTTRCTR
jgi:hypothetical protein